MFFVLFAWFLRQEQKRKKKRFGFSFWISSPVLVGEKGGEWDSFFERGEKGGKWGCFYCDVFFFLLLLFVGGQ